MSSNHKHLLAVALLAGCWTQSLEGAPEEKQLTALYVSSPILIDGILDEREWTLAQPATDFTQKEPR